MKLKFLKGFLIVLLLGTSIGVISAYGDTLINNGQFDLILLITGYFNTATIWGTASFLAGYRSRSIIKGPIRGVFLLIAAVTSYYLYGYILGDRANILISVLLRTALLWALVGIVVGTIYGAAGSIYKFSKNIKLRVVAVALLSLLLFSENGYYIYQSKDYFFNNSNQSILFIFAVFAGVLLPFILLKNFKHALIALLIAFAFSSIGILILSLILDVIR